MLSLSEFKKLAGKEAQGFSDKELERFRDIMSQLADHLFDMWTNDLKKDNSKDDQNG